MVSGQSFGSSAVSLAGITSMCSVQGFRGGHSLRLAFGFSLLFAVVVKPFSFYVVFGYAWILCNRCLLTIVQKNLIVNK